MPQCIYALLVISMDQVSVSHGCIISIDIVTIILSSPIVFLEIYSVGTSLQWQG